MRRPVWLLLIASLAIAYPLAIALAISIGSTFEAALVAAATVYAVVGALIVWYRPGNAIGRLFVVLGLAIPLSIIGSAYGQVGLPGAAWASWSSSLAFAVIFGALLIFLPLLFPTGRYLSDRWRRFGQFAAGLLVAIGLLLALSPGELDCCPGTQNPIQLPQLDPVVGIIPFLFPVVVATALVAMTSLVLRFRRSRGVEREQLKWFTLAVGWICLVSIVGAFASVGLIAENQLAPVIMYPSGVAAIGLAVGVAILRHRLYDIDVIIRRTLVYGALSVILAALYVAAVLALQALLSGWTGGDTLAVAVSTLVVAAVFRPLRSRIQRGVNRRFYRSGYDAARTLETFGARLRNEIDLDSLSAELSAVVQTTMQPASLSVWVRR